MTSIAANRDLILTASVYTQTFINCEQIAKVTTKVEGKYSFKSKSFRTVCEF